MANINPYQNIYGILEEYRANGHISPLRMPGIVRNIRDMSVPARHYWKDVLSRSGKETWAESLGFRSAEQIVIKGVYAVAVLAALLWAGSDDAGWDQIVSYLAVAGALPFVFLLVWAWNFIRLPAKDLAEKDLKIAALEDTQEKRQAAQTVIDDLAEDVSWAIAKILNGQPPADNLTDEAISAFKKGFEEWCARVSAKMENRTFFTRADQLHFDRLGVVPMLNLYPNQKVNHTLSMLSLKLDRLRDVIKWSQERIQ